MKEASGVMFRSKGLLVIYNKNTILKSNEPENEFERIDLRIIGKKRDIFALIEDIRAIFCVSHFLMKSK